MNPLDLTIVGLYFVGLLGAGVWLASRAGRSSDDYFLGGRKLPWWALGASGMSSNLDVAGTMTLVTLFYLFGFHALFIEMRGGVVLPIAIFAAFMGAWHRRSEVMTTAEWMLLRFGRGAAGRAARMTAALTYTVITIGMVVFFLGAAGKFLSEFLPLPVWGCQVLMLAVALIYTMLSGLHGVVWTDVFQAFLIGAAAIYVAVLGTIHWDSAVAAGWPGGAWNFLPPTWNHGGLRTENWDYSAFGWLMLAWATKGILEGLGGSGGSAYMAQRFYAAPTEKDCRKIGLVWTVLFAFRWPMVAGFAVLAAVLGAGTSDPESILPKVLNSDFFPAGVRGLVIAAMLAAAMSTFDSTINAGAAYLVNDFYAPLRKATNPKELVAAGYVASAVIVLAGLAIALQVESIVEVWVVIVINLFPAFLVPFALRWYWARMNGWGFVWGVISGFAAAMGVFFFAPSEGWSEAASLGVIAGFSAFFTVGISFLMAPVSTRELREFHDRIRPFGLWPSAWMRVHRKQHRTEMLNGGFALVWQMCTFLLPLTVMARMWSETAILGALWVVLGVRLLNQEPAGR